MKINAANKIIERIERLANQLEHDEELKKLDERYSVAASWVDLDIDNVSL